jgi:hypothetical protein
MESKKSKGILSAILTALLVYNIFGFSIFVYISAKSAPNGNKVVYSTYTGECYHKASCKYLNRSKLKTTIEKAVENGLRRCSICEPPRYRSQEDFENRKSNIEPLRDFFTCCLIAFVPLLGSMTILFPLMYDSVPKYQAKYQFITGYLTILFYLLIHKFL